MKKQDKIDIIQTGINNTLICRCYFTYDSYYSYCYPIEVNSKFLLGQEEDDFLLDGYSIRKISQLSKVVVKDDKCNKINKKFGITNQVKNPNIDISNWKSIFESLKELNTYIIIEDEINDEFAIGIIEKVFDNKLYFRSFDADGIWDEDVIEFKYSHITSVSWDTRYANYWKRYLESL